MKEKIFASILSLLACVSSGESVVAPVIEPAPIVEIVYDDEILPEEDIRLIALVTMAEAEGEPERGQRLVIDTVLNRMDDPCWPDTASGVIYQKNQFTSMSNGRVKRCKVTEELCQLVREELHERQDSRVVYFRTGRYSSYGTPAFKCGNHYFSYK